MTLETLPPPDQPDQPDQPATGAGGHPPNPLELAKKIRRPVVSDAPLKQLECLACERVTPHEIGPATHGRDGSLLVQWWTCAECREARTVG